MTEGVCPIHALVQRPPFLIEVDVLPECSVACSLRHVPSLVRGLESPANSISGRQGWSVESMASTWPPDEPI